MSLTHDEFVEHLTVYGLVTFEDVYEAAAKVVGDRDPDSLDPSEMAEELVRSDKLTGYQAEALLTGRHETLCFGDYVVLDVIGKGGMGVVYKAIHRIMQRVVAVKRLPQKAMQTQALVDRFYREVRAAAKLMHPNIVAAYDAGAARDSHYLVMEFVDGEDLSYIVNNRGALPLPQAVDLILQAARGLSYAHSQGVVHRDIKPGNMLVTYEGGVLKLLDMGLARVEQAVANEVKHESEKKPSESTITAEGKLMGTVEYMAPEQAADAHRADHRSDIYSLGCTLYRLVTGRLPFRGKTTVQTIVAHTNNPIPLMRQKLPDVPDGLEAVYTKMVAKDPVDRFQSMQNVVDELEQLIRDDVVPKWTPPPPPPLSERKKPRMSEDIEDSQAQPTDTSTIMRGSEDPSTVDADRGKMTEETTPGSIRYDPKTGKSGVGGGRAEGEEQRAPANEPRRQKPGDDKNGGRRQAQSGDGKAPSGASTQGHDKAKASAQAGKAASGSGRSASAKSGKAEKTARGSDLPTQSLDPSDIPVALPAGAARKRKKRQQREARKQAVGSAARRHWKIALIIAGAQVAILILLWVVFGGGAKKNVLRPLPRVDGGGTGVDTAGPGGTGQATRRTPDGETGAALQPGWTDLLAWIEPARHAAAGTWEKVDGKLILKPGTDRPFLTVPVEPSGDYQVIYRFIGEGPGGGADLILPIRGSQVRVVVDGFDDQHLTGLDSVDGWRLYDPGNPTQRSSFRIIPGELHELSVRVDFEGENVHLVAMVDEQLMIDWIGRPQQLKPGDESWTPPRPNAITVAGWRAPREIRALHFKMSDGEPTRLEIEAVNPPTPEPVATPTRRPNITDPRDPRRRFRNPDDRPKRPSRSEPVGPSTPEDKPVPPEANPSVPEDKPVTTDVDASATTDDGPDPSDVHQPLDPASLSAVVPGRWVELLRFVNLDRDVVSGKWNIANGQLLAEPDAESPPARPRLLMDPPSMHLPVVVKGSYEIEFYLSCGQRAPGNTFVALPVGDRRVRLVLEASGEACGLASVGEAEGGARTPGLARLAGADIRKNGTSRGGVEFVDGRPREVNIRVVVNQDETASIAVKVNRQLVAAWTGSIRELSDVWRLVKRRRLPRRGQIGLASTWRQTTYRGLRVRALDGELLLIHPSK